MKPIEGLDLGALTDQAHREFTAEQEAVIRRKISMIHGRLNEARGSIPISKSNLLKLRSVLLKSRQSLPH